MAWTGIDTLDYSNGVNLNTQNGGSGWSGAWSGDTNFTITTSSPMEGSAMVTFSTAAGGKSVKRSLTTGEAKGVVHVRGKTSTANSSNGWQIFLWSGANFAGIIRQQSGSTLKLFDNLTLTAIENSSITDSTEFALYTEYDCDTDKYRAKIGSAPSSTWYNFFNGTTGTVVDAISVSNVDVITATLNFDDIKSGASSGPTNLKSLDTNTKSNIKSYNTNAIANIKSINTNA